MNRPYKEHPAKRNIDLRLDATDSTPIIARPNGLKLQKG